MQNHFGIIAEGATDFMLLKNILYALFNEQDKKMNNKIRQIQPPLDETHQGKSKPGGWTQVFEYCRSNKFQKAFQFHQYIIIQIDTDTCDETNYDISKHNNNGKAYKPHEIVEKVQKKLIDEKITEAIYQKYAPRIFFAICVESAECWLLPLYYPNNKTHRKTTVNCLKKLNQALKKQGFTIDPNRKEDKFPDAVKDFRKKKTVMDCYPHNPSFKIFIDTLLAANIRLSVEPETIW